MLLIFFFFQAEDGIRDLTVTGVQTCALPIALASFAQTPPQVAVKQLVADLSTVQPGRLDNMEAMSWGPPLPDGTRVLVFASDDNFNPAQANQILITAYRPSPPCAP